ncbi:MAG: glycosyltransferase [Rubripirellula sp.]
MRAILSAPGSRGDVNPMIAIGKCLLERGHEVVISLAEPYAEVAASQGLEVEPVISAERFVEALGDANVWKPIRGPVAIFREIVNEFLPLHDQIIRKYHVAGETVLVAHPLDLASRIFRDADPDTPMATVHLQPSLLRTATDPPRLSPWWFEIRKPAWAVRASYQLIDHVAVDPLLRGPVNVARRSLNLPPVRRVLHQWWLSPDRILAMYPDWYAPATREFCPRLVHCGFPLADNGGKEFDVPDDKPIVFTSGTAHHHCREFFVKACEACEILQRPGLLLSTHDENFPPDLPPNVRRMAYASFAELLPHCSAIVHHGGVGTTSQAIAAGIPQIIRPLAFDQFDNAMRVERLGCGRWLRSDKYLTSTLRTILSESSSHLKREEIACRLQHSHAALTAAIEIEQLRHDQTLTH